MPGKQIITGQRIHPELLKRAREMRRNMTPAEHRLWQRLRAWTPGRPSFPPAAGDRWLHCGFLLPRSQPGS